MITNKIKNNIPTVAKWFETQRESVRDIENYKVIFSYLEIVRKSYKELKGLVENGNISNQDFVKLMKEFNISVFHDFPTGRLAVGQLNDEYFSKVVKEMFKKQAKPELEKLDVEVHSKQVFYKEFTTIDTLNFNVNKNNLKATKAGILLEKNNEEIFELLKKTLLKAIDKNEKIINQKLDSYPSMKINTIEFFQSIVLDKPTTIEKKLQEVFWEVLKTDGGDKCLVLSENFLQTVHYHKLKEKPIKIDYFVHDTMRTVYIYNNENVVGTSSKSILSLLLLKLNYPTEYPSVIVSDIETTYNPEKEYPIGFQKEHRLTDSFVHFLKEIEGETRKRISDFSSTEIGAVEQKINSYLKTMRLKVNKFPHAQKHHHYQDRVFVEFIKEYTTIIKE